MQAEVTPELFGFDDIAHDDVVLLESLVKSPVFGALKRALKKYEDVCMSELLSGNDTHKLYQTQGRVIGIRVVENLPVILVRRQKELERQAENKRRLEGELAKRKKRIFDPKLPPVPSRRPPRGALK